LIFDEDPKNSEGGEIVSNRDGMGNNTGMSAEATPRNDPNVARLGKKQLGKTQFMLDSLKTMLDLPI